MGCSSSTTRDQKDMVIEDKRDLDSGPIESDRIVSSSPSPDADVEQQHESRRPGPHVAKSDINEGEVNEDQKVVDAVISYMEENSTFDDEGIDDSSASDSKETTLAAKPVSEEQVAVERALEELKESVFGAPVSKSAADIQSNGSFTGSI